jgi:hypothetical protein
MAFLKRAAIVASAAVVVSLAAASPVDAGVTPTTGEGETATLTVNKVVQGTAPADAEFVIIVECEESGPYELSFGPEGGAEDVVFFDADLCTVTETQTGGAVDVTPPVDIEIASPVLYEVTITNVFDTAPSSSSTSSSVASDTTTRPTFTG